METLFFEPQHYLADSEGYRLLPFRFMDVDDRKLVVNEAGEHLFLDPDVFEAFITHSLPPDSDSYFDLKGKHFLKDSSSSIPERWLALKYRTKRSLLAEFTRLHIFVVTLRCDTSCQYCQVSRVSINRSKYDMTHEAADKALDLVFRSPAATLKIEFQGGEPLLNFELIQYITLEAQRRNQVLGKNLEFVVATNLSLVSDELLAFLKEHRIWVSTSLDGPAHIHNSNRPRPGNNAYETTIHGIEKVRAVLGPDSIAALMTTTKLSLEYPEEIVNEYVDRGYSYMFLRPLSPYGFAVKTQKRTGYDLQAFPLILQARS